MSGLPRPGQVVYVDRSASVQFTVFPILFRVIRVRTDLTTYAGWAYLDGYALDAKGDAVQPRTIWVQPAGLHYVDAKPDPRRAGHNGGPAIPHQRTTTDTIIRSTL